MREHQEFKEMLKDLGITKKDVADITGNTYDSVRSSTQPSKPFPRNLKLAVWVWKKLRK